MSVQTPELAFLAQDPALAPFIKEGVAVVVWSADGTRALWASNAARPLVDEIAPGGEVRPGSAMLERLSALASGLAPRKGVRLERLRLDPAPGAEVLTCACHMLALPNGTNALLTAVVGRLPATFRPLRDDEAANAPDPGQESEPLASEPAEAAADAPSPPDQPARPAEFPAATQSVPAGGKLAPMTSPYTARVGGMAIADPIGPQPEMPVDSADAETDPIARVRMLARTRPRWRFVWETDASGRFSKVADELAEALGPASGDVLGQTWWDLIGKRVADPSGQVAEAFDGRITWTARDIPWRVASTDLAVLVDLSAVPVSGEGGAFAGYRGFGICRLDTLHRFGGFVDEAANEPAKNEQTQSEPIAGPQPVPAQPEATAAAPAVSSSPAALAASPSPAAPSPAASSPAFNGPAAAAAPPLAQAAPQQPARTAAAPLVDTMRTAAVASFRDGMRASVGSGQAEPARPRTAIPAYGATGTEPARPAASPAASVAEPIAAPDATAVARPAPPVPAVPPPSQAAPASLQASAPAQQQDSTPQPGDPGTKEYGAIRHQASGGFLPMQRITATPRAAKAPDAAAAEASAPETVAPATDATLPQTSATAPEPASTIVAPQASPSMPEPPAQQRAVPASPAKPLSADDQRSLREIARVLGERRVHEAPTGEAAEAEAAQPASPDLPASDLAASELPVSEPTLQEPTPQEPAAPVTAASPSTPEPVEAQAAAAAPVPAAPPGPARTLPDTGDVLDRLPQALLVTRERRVLYANEALLDLIGAGNIDEIEQAGGMEALLRGKVAQGPGKDAPLALVSLRGDAVPVDARVVGIVWEGEPATMVVANADIDNAEQARRRAIDLDLRAKEVTIRELRAILDTATDGVAVLDADGRIVSLNRSAEALFGYEQAEVAGGSLAMLLAPESHAVALDYLEGLRANGVASILNDGRDVVGRVRQGGAIPLFMTLGPIADGADARYCAVLRDMSAWKKAETELVDARRAAERANSHKSDFLAKISHEIRTPLNAIIGFAEVMLEERFGPIGNDRYKDYLRDVHASGGHVISLVNDLLDLAKIEAGKIDLNFTGVDLNELVAGSAALLQPQATRERIVLRSSLQPNLPPVVADERSLRQVLLNILSNAVKFTDPGGQVIVSTALTDRGEVALRVRDSGIGMSETEVKQALEPFRQLATTRRGGGTGLGLPLTKAMVEANRGQFAITSAKGEGTLVEVIFPPTRVLAS